MRDTPLAIEALDWRLLQPAHVTHETVPLPMAVGALHHEIIQFQVISSPKFLLVIGYPWLQRHNPSFDWLHAEVLSWSPQCSKSCFQKVAKVLCTSSLSSLLEEYRDFSGVFDKGQAGSLPPHRSYDCAIDVQPGAIPPHGWVYPLSVLEDRSMEEYVADALSRGFIRKSSSPAGAGFFFVKKSGELRPFIGYRGLNRFTIKNAYLIPLFTELFDRLKGATVFTKLDLRGAYNLVRIKENDVWKTAFNTRTGHYEYLVMPFGLCNAPAVFLTISSEICCSYVWWFILTISSYFASPWRATTHMSFVCFRNRENNLYCKLEKCEFHREQVKFLSFSLLVFRWTQRNFQQSYSCPDPWVYVLCSVSWALPTIIRSLFVTSRLWSSPWLI